MNASPERVDLAGLVLEVGNVVAEDSEASVDLLHSISLAGVPEIIVKIVYTFKKWEIERFTSWKPMASAASLRCGGA